MEGHHFPFGPCSTLGVIAYSLFYEASLKMGSCMLSAIMVWPWGRNLRFYFGKFNNLPAEFSILKIISIVKQRILDFVTANN